MRIAADRSERRQASRTSSAKAESRRSEEPNLAGTSINNGPTAPSAAPEVVEARLRQAFGADFWADRAAPETAQAAPLPLQREAVGEPAALEDPERIRAIGGRGVDGGGGPLPHLEAIQKAFGKHDVSDIVAHTGEAAATASRAIRAKAYTMGNDIAFAGEPSLHTAAHEAAHVIQQRGGIKLRDGVGEAGDRYERHADAVADRVVAGQSSEELLNSVAPAAEQQTSHALQAQKAGPEENPPLTVAAPPELSLFGPDIPPPSVFRSGASVGLTVYFGQNHFLLDIRNANAVKTLANELKLMVEPTVSVDGHASTEGDKAYNQSLSERRRELVVALLSEGVEPKPTFGGKGHGEDQPAVAEEGSGKALEALRARNRRVEIMVLAKPAARTFEPSLEPSLEPAVKPKPKLKLWLTPEEFEKLFPPETPEERLNRILREPPVEPAKREKKSLSDLTNEALDKVIDKILKGVGIEDPKKRDWIRPKLRDAVKSGVSRAVDSVIDSTNLDPTAKEALKKGLEAGAKQGF